MGSPDGEGGADAAGAPGVGRLVVPRRSLLKGAAVVGGSALLAACNPRGRSATSTTPRGIRLTDQRGETVVFDRPVTRIVTLPMPAASIVMGVDQTAQHVVGMHDASWVAIRDGIMGEIFPEALDVAHDVAAQDFSPNVESIVALEPDVVVQWADEGAGIITPLENAGLNVVGVTYGTQEDVNTWLTLFATMLGKPERAREMISRVDSQVAEVESLAAGQSAAPPKVLYFNRFADELKVAGRETYNDYYISLVGATNPASGDDGARGAGMVGVDVEQVLTWDPDVILLGNFDAAIPDDVYGDAVWQDVSAVRSRRVYKVPLGGYRWDPPSHESPLMWRWLSEIAFPGRISGDLRRQVRGYYRFLYGHTPTDAQLDTILWTDVNGKSANYQEFHAT